MGQFLTTIFGYLTDQLGNGFVDASKNLFHGLAEFKNLVKFILIIHCRVADRFQFHFQADKRCVHFAYPVHQNRDKFILKFIAGFRFKFIEQLLIQLQNPCIGFSKDVSRAGSFRQK